MKSILITGGTGTFGTAFTRRLLRDNLAERIAIFSRGEHKQAEMRENLGEDRRARYMVGDVRDFWRLKEAMYEVDTVIHAAALKRVEVGEENATEMFSTNCIGAMNVIRAAQECKVKQVVALSTDKAFEALNTYGKSKALAEDLFLSENRHRRTNFVAVRYGNIFGSNGSIVPRWLNMVRSGRLTVPVTDPDCTRFFMRVDEAVQLVLGAVRPNGHIFDDLAADMAFQKEARDRSGIIIPELPAYRLGDLATAMGVDMKIIGLPPWEKKHESMSAGNSSDKARRMTIDELRAEL